MRPLLILLPFLLLGGLVNGQQFQWANSYDITNCNEVAAIAADSSGNIFLTGVYGAAPTLPYTGDAYVMKTDPEGGLVWTTFLEGSLNVADMISDGMNAVIAGQANGAFTYEGETYGSEGYYFFIIKLDGDGELQWIFTDETLYGIKASLASGSSGNFAVHARGTGNIGDWILIFGPDGETLNSKLLSPVASMIVDMAYHDGRVYLNGGFTGPGTSIVIDGVVIYLPPVENATFVLALDEDLVAEWVSVDTAFNNFDGRVVAGPSGVYAYTTVIEPPFTLMTYVKKFSPEGTLLAEKEVPLFSNAVAHYPDMAYTNAGVALFVSNDFNFDSHKLLVFDYDLDSVSDWTVDGPSDLYSGQVTGIGDDLFIAHVFSGDLDFGGEITLPYDGTGKLPYLAKIGEPDSTGTGLADQSAIRLSIYPNPAGEYIRISGLEKATGTVECSIHDINGRELLRNKVNASSPVIDLGEIGPGVYLLALQNAETGLSCTKFIVR